jgi:Na+-driven multidrug efflux pump
LIPLAAFNYGKGDKKRLKDAIFYGILDTGIIMLACMIGLEIFARKIAGIFALSPEILDICANAMRIIAAGYLFAGINIAFQGIFQAIEKGGYSLIISMIRMVIVALPLAWLFVQFAPDKTMVFAAFSIAEFCGTIAACLLYRKERERLHFQESK